MHDLLIEKISSLNVVKNIKRRREEKKHTIEIIKINKNV